MHPLAVASDPARAAAMSDLPLGHERAARCGNVFMDMKIGAYHQCMALAVAPRREQIEHTVFERNGWIAILAKSSEDGRDGK
jgi:hypothetical protein